MVIFGIIKLLLYLIIICLDIRAGQGVDGIAMRRPETSDSVETSCVVVPELALFGLAHPGQHLVEDLNPTAIFNCLGRDGPVATEHDPIEAESLDRDVDVALELIASPMLMIRFGCDAGDLAGNVRETCEL